jgi:retinol dehydrogenase-12
MNGEFVASADGLESELQINVLSPALLSLLLLPNFHLASSFSKLPSTPRPHLTFVSSGLHTMAKFPERKLGPGEILPALNNRAQYSQSDRYSVTKTIGLLWMRELASRVQSSDIVINAVNPGFCKTGLMRNTSGVMYYLSRVTQFLLGREVADGARCLIDAAVIKGPETHGLYLSEMQVKAESDLVRSAEGKELEGRLWEEIVALLGQHGLDVENLP